MVQDVITVEIAKTLGILIGGLILLKFSSILFPYIKTHTRKTTTLWDDAVFEVFKRITQFAVIALIFYYINGIVDEPRVTEVSEIVLIFLGAYLATRVTDYLITLVEQRVIKETVTRLDDLALPMLAKTSKIVFYAAAFLITLDQLGYDITALLAGLGIAGIAVSLAAKDSISSAIAGIFLMLERPFLPGDRIELWNAPPDQATWGDVVEVGLRSTKVKTTDNITIIIPNSQLMNRDIINYTQGSSVIRVRIPAGVSYQSNLETVEKVLMEAIGGIEGILEDPPPQVVVKQFGDSSIDVELRVWIENAKERRRIQDEINRKIKLEFEKSSIEMPYPMREVKLSGEVGYLPCEKDNI